MSNTTEVFSGEGQNPSQQQPRGRWRWILPLVGFVLLLGVDGPMSFADTPLSFDWAIDTVVGAIIATNPPRIRAPQTDGMFILAPNG